MPILVGNEHIRWMKADSKLMRVCSRAPHIFVCVVGWEAESAAHHPTHQAQRLGLLMSSWAMLGGPPHPGLRGCWQSSCCDGLPRARTHTHTEVSAVFLFDHTCVWYVSSGKIRHWCLRWLQVYVPLCGERAVGFHWRTRSLLVSESVVLCFKCIRLINPSPVT